MAKTKKKEPENYDFHGIQIVQDGAEFDNRKAAVEHLATLGVDRTRIKARMQSHLDFAKYAQSNYEWYLETEPDKTLAYESVQTTRNKRDMMYA